jgi:ADP-ribose pyrophosphatase YjhB (NUDIX family)
VPVALAVQPVGAGVLLVRRAQDPGRGLWALPGGYLNPHEAPDDAAVRELQEETGVGGREPRLVAVMGGLRDNTVIIAYRMEPVTELDRLVTDSPEEVLDVQVFLLDELPLLAFSAHEEILAAVFQNP